MAQGLAFGASVPVLPVDSLLAVAEEARHAAPARHSRRLQVTALLDARMDEMYCATYAYDGGLLDRTLHGSALVRPRS